MSPSEPPLRGVRVLDLTRLLPGPVCTQHLADLGADVVKVEDTGAGDYAPPALRAIVNRNKRGLQLDLKQPEGAEALLRLARDADVLIEGFRPGAMAGLGLGYDTVAAVNPRIVYCSLTGYGQSGPYRDRPGHDLNYCGHAGVADQIGVDADTPALSNLPIADLMGGALSAAMGILAALFDAARTGRGRHLDIAMADGALAHAVMPLATLAAHGSTRRAGGDTLTGGLACYGQYRTADDRFVAVGALERKFWDALCDVIERADLKPLHRTGDATVESAGARRARGDLRRKTARTLGGALRSRRLLRLAGANARRSAGRPALPRARHGGRQRASDHRCADAGRVSRQDDALRVRAAPPRAAARRAHGRAAARGRLQRRDDRRLAAEGRGTRDVALAA